jgi:hypothetical protein
MPIRLDASAMSTTLAASGGAGVAAGSGARRRRIWKFQRFDLAEQGRERVRVQRAQRRFQPQHSVLAL